MWEGDLWVAVRAARAGAELVHQAMGDPFSIEMKGATDPVTDIDKASEAAVIAMIRTHFPDDDVLGEEGGGTGWQADRVWVIDPLDGTVNFVHGFPHIAVSVALWEGGQPQIGVVIDVGRNEEFVAQVDSGVRVNTTPVSVSATDDFSSALLVTGFPYDRNRHGRAYLESVGDVLEQAQGVRRLGSAALDLAWVACGRLDGYWEYGIAPWDAAAGVVLVAEAGGSVTDHRGAPHRLDAPAIVASNGIIHEELRVIVEKNFPRHLE